MRKERLLRRRDALASLLAIAATKAMAQADPAFGLDRFDSEEAAPPVLVPTRIRYGVKATEAVQVYRPRRTKAGPLVVIVGGAWWRSGIKRYPYAWLPNRLVEEGYVVAAIATAAGHRAVSDLLRDNVRAIAALRGDAAHHGWDGRRVILLGLESNAVLAALLGTDETYLHEAELPIRSVEAVISVNGAGFDMPRYLARCGRYTAASVEQAFGADQQAQARWSPLLHLPPSSAAHFLFVAGDSEALASSEARDAVQTLVARGMNARMVGLPTFRSSAATTFLAEPRGAGWLLIEFLRNVVPVAD